MQNLSLLDTGFRRSARGTGMRRFQLLLADAGRGAGRLAHRCDLFLRAWGARRLVREMQAWPDERLKDIGLARADLDAAIAGVRRPFRWVPDHDARQMDPARFGH